VKFIYVDESGARDQGDVFVMCGLMVDAYKLRKKTEGFDRMLEAMFQKHPGTRADLKTSRFINGSGGWSQVDATERKQFLTDLCNLAVDNGGKIFGIALSFADFDTARAAGHGHPFGNSHWLAAATFTSSLVQKKMQGVKNSKGLTVVIMDDNKRDMPALSEAIHKADPWFDGLYQVQKRKRGKSVWVERKEQDRFDHIVDTAFAVKSDHSSFVQVSDAISYVYRRHIELMTVAEAWKGEKTYYEGLVAQLERSRESIGRTPDTPSIKFFEQAKHAEWKL